MMDMRCTMDLFVLGQCQQIFLLVPTSVEGIIVPVDGAPFPDTPPFAVLAAVLTPLLG